MATSGELRIRVSGPKDELRRFRDVLQVQGKNRYSTLNFSNFIPVLKATGVAIILDQGKYGIIVIVGKQVEESEMEDYLDDPMVETFLYCTDSAGNPVHFIVEKGFSTDVHLPSVGGELIEEAEDCLVYNASGTGVFEPKHSVSLIRLIGRAFPELEFWFKYRWNSRYSMWGWGRVKGTWCEFEDFNSQAPGQECEVEWSDHPHCYLKNREALLKSHILALEARDVEAYEREFENEERWKHTYNDWEFGQFEWE
ncbi:hypothetical protein [Gloeobacter kilaueensis]|uniref:Uncharacterized protein n=1 Tax=Gloeobacter kilaueensis (strain ATCC BAA-2537 / CCAP 1431/1 / ULC 316 / JS1) TaxID=1183438 RepID=U5QIA1_GLOK1|nr:hypothetical protein [Gloeobacter kilaueensis]AGY57314.1 hypothetical protein GKIL_1068 [Gloeobacter kilaueensis JS1]